MNVCLPDNPKSVLYLKKAVYIGRVQIEGRKKSEMWEYLNQYKHVSANWKIERCKIGRYLEFLDYDDYDDDDDDDDDNDDGKKGHWETSVCTLYLSARFPEMLIEIDWEPFSWCWLLFNNSIFEAHHRCGLVT